MLGIFVIAGCVLMICAGPPINGYSLGTLSGGRGQEYSSGYRSGGFIGIKDSQGDLNEHLGGGGYAAPGSNRYSVIAGGASGHQSPVSSYSSDSGYSDPSSSHSDAYGGHSSGGNPDALSISSSSYSSDPGAHGSSSDLGGAGSYSSSGSPSGLGSYSSVSSAGSSGSGGNQVGSGFVGYSEGSGGHAVSGLAEHGPAEYSSSSHPSSSYMSYTIGGPKASAYTASSGGHGHGISYSSSPSVGYISGGGHRGGSSHPSSSYSSEASHPGISSGPSYSSSSLGSFLANMHSGGPSNYIRGSSGHRGSHNHIFAAAANPSPNYSSRGPSPGYYSSNPFPRGGGKIIIVKEGSGGHVGHMYPGEQHSYTGGMFGGASGGGYKIRSVGSSPSYGPSYASGYSSTRGHAGGGGYPGSNHGASFFGLL